MNSNRSLTSAQQLTKRECFREIASLAARGKVVFVAGAGVSMGPPGRLPGWEDMMLAILREIAGPPHANEVELFRPHMRYLFNEVMLRRLVMTLGRHAPGAAALNHVGELLQACLTFRGSNLSHATIVWAAANFGNSMLTMNFDMLFENACSALGVTIDIPKLHGSLDDLNGARFTFDQVMSPLTDNLKDRGRQALADCTMAVAVGYNGQDEFDVMPLLFERPSPLKNIYWIVHDTGNAPTLPFESAFARDSRLAWCRADTEALWRYLLKKLGTRGGTPELELNWKEPTRKRASHWWKRGVAQWGQRMRRAHGESLAYLWADLLDEMRIYRDAAAPAATNNPAANAYARAIKMSAPDSAAILFGRTQLAIMQQRLGQGHARDFIKIRRDIRGDCLAPGAAA